MKNAVVVGGFYALCLNLILAVARAQAADFYVATSGSDANPGTSAQPFRTITRAYSVASAGTTIIVSPGVYTDYRSGWGLHLGKSGTAASPIVLRSQTRGAAIIDGGNVSDRNQGLYIDGSYNIVDGFEIRNAPHGGIALYGNGNQILNNHIHHNGNPASSSGNGQDGVYSNEGTSGNVYKGNYVHHNGRTGSNLDHGLYLCGRNEVVINNVLVANAATGLQIAGYTTVSNMKVYNNVVAWNGTTGIILWLSLSGVDIKNNLIYKNGNYGVGSYDAHGSGVVMDHNLVFGNSGGTFNFTGGGSDFSYNLGTTLYLDPRFANAAATGFDAHLAIGSPAIQAGLNLSSAFTTDLAGAPRSTSGTWDMGAYVSGAGVADTTPPNVSLTGPGNGTMVAGAAVVVAATAADNVGVAGVQFKVDGVSLGTADTTAPYSLAWDTTKVPNGSHTLSATAFDTAGNQRTATALTIQVNNTVSATPSVTVAATTPAASRIGPINGVFTITRSGSTTSALTVNYSLDGTALNGVDCNLLGTSLTIPAGAASATITVKPLQSASYVGTKTVVLTLMASPAYLAGAANNATITIAGNSLPCKIGKAPHNDVKISWAGVAGKVYRVAYKTNLSDTAWTDLSGPITATGTNSSYTDTTATVKTQRYYVVYVTN